MAVLRRIRNLFKRASLDCEIEAELNAHIELRIEDNVASGMSPDEARRDALLRFGNQGLVKESVSAADAALTLESAWWDICSGLRQFKRSPGFSITSVLILALGIGASTAIFSALNPILLKSLPYPGASQIVMIWDTRMDGRPMSVTFGTYQELVLRSHALSESAVLKPWQPTMIGRFRPERLEGQRVSSSYFRVLGVPPALGRDFDPSDDRPKGPAVVILSDALWRERFGGDRAIVGRQVMLDGDSFIVIGVAPRSFENVLAPDARIWTTMQYDPSLPADGREWGHHLEMVARLQRRIGIDQAIGELNTIARQPVPEFHRASWARLDHGFVVRSLQADITSQVKPAMLATFAAVSLLLIIACANVVNLQIARGVQRRGEFAIRAALGAGRRRLARQRVMESLLITSLSSALGMGIAIAGVRMLVALCPPGMPRVSAIGFDFNVLCYALAVTTITGLLSGLLSGSRDATSDMQAALQESSTRFTQSGHAVRHALVVTEISLAVLLLVCTGLLWRSMRILLSVDPGFNGHRLITMQVQAAGHQFDDDNYTRLFFRKALTAVKQVPGVQSAAFTSQLPLSGDYDVYGARSSNEPPGTNFPVFRYAVSPDYFRTMGIPLFRGRMLNDDDGAGSPGVVLISRSFAAHKFGGEDPLGTRLSIGGKDPSYTYIIVGIVGDVRQMSLAQDETDAVYTTTDQWQSADSTLSLVVRPAGEAASVFSPIRAAIWSVDKDQAIVRAATMEELLAASAAERRFVLTLFEIFALVALVLASGGIYGVLSGSVLERIPEIGVRAAFGASRSDILLLVLRRGTTLTLLGIAIGLAGSVFAGRVLRLFLFHLFALDPLTYVTVTGIFFCVSLLAALLPALRAASIDPLKALRRS